MTRRTILTSLPLLPLALGEDAATPLFDGKSLGGWSVVDGPDASFHVSDGDLVITSAGNFPTWLRSVKTYENFDLSLEFFVKGWADGAIYLHAPTWGRPIESGFAIKLFQKTEDHPKPESIGAIFPVVAPTKVNVRNKGEWNTLRARFDWPSLQVWINGDIVQDLNVENVPKLRHRLRSGYLGIASLGYPLRFRNMTIKELASKEKWTMLYETPADMSNWTLLESPTFEPIGNVLRADGLGYLATKAEYKDFEFQCYIRSSKHANGGVIFRAGDNKSANHYEIQIHDVEGAVYPTGSLYGFQRASYPRIEPERWYPFQLIVQGPRCIVRVNGETVLDYPSMERLEAGRIMLQAHQRGKWIEYRQICVKAL